MERTDPHESEQVTRAPADFRLDTKLAQAGNRRDPATGAISPPVYYSTAYAHPALGQSTGYDYTRTGNPTRQILEETIADLEQGVRGFAFASGMAAISTVFGLLRPGDHLVASNDLYGGTYRLLQQVLGRIGIEAAYVDTGDLAAVERAIQPNTKALFIETPSNPTMKITDIAACAALARTHGVWTVVDNTFMTPYFQQPLALGADIVVHSATKYLGGHNDVMAGLIVVRDDTLAEQIGFLQNSIGAVLGPQDAWLLLRGMKTLALRMARHEQNSLAIADWLRAHPSVEKVYYPGLADHPRRDIHVRQARGFGGMIAFEVKDSTQIAHILASVKLISFAESLGGVETLLTYPARQTHADIPQDIREQCGVTERLLRLSVGIEDAGDLLRDLDQAFSIQ
ncbi:PLP-dependent transferase [Alicyclobacillus cycloheptanicus]|uniref:Cystathionine gamma-synthase n=1 Tax=Alicyclobacillus cycloheptanicus TaxID=1457 RepID=A0ABT9XIG1_9BACL|nr:PLP-dependent aspartate aminotransferase family protein [Alicyclobacillus cycloheptanicus]MDQ0190104.1 cystathionine gamma-synthase [Alicyclobacillus cycloheptanicus]WDM02078.1 PLP-dependent transferase [Alicyclobacillus cycloheptanicus]